MAKTRFKAKIGNRSYTFVGNSSDEHMQAVTDLMNQQLEQLNHLSNQISFDDAIILLAFNALSDQLKLQHQIDILKQQDEE